MHIALFGESKTNLVATKLPEGYRLYDTPGHSEDPARLEAFARRCGNCPAEIKIFSADEVGLEWHDNGTVKAWSEEHRKGRYCVITPILP